MIRAEIEKNCYITVPLIIIFCGLGLVTIVSFTACVFEYSYRHGTISDIVLLAKNISDKLNITEQSDLLSLIHDKTRLDNIFPRAEPILHTSSKLSAYNRNLHYN